MKPKLRSGAVVTGVALTAALGTTSCTINAAPSTGAAGKPAAAKPAPTPSKSGRTIIKYVTVTPPGASVTSPPVRQVTPTQAGPVQPTTQVQAPNVTDPWAVVSAYYGDVESGNYPEAYALLGSGMVTGQSYQDFVNGYSCTGSETVSENWENGDRVNFNLVAYDNCSGATQYFTGTDTVQGGKIVAADVTQTG